MLFGHRSGAEYNLVLRKNYPGLMRDGRVFCRWHVISPHQAIPFPIYVSIAYNRSENYKQCLRTDNYLCLFKPEPLLTQ
jgi:hypothetical protein